MSKLMELLEKHPEEKEEFDTIIEVLNAGSNEEIKMWIEYANDLEKMIEEKASIEKMLERIDKFYCLTEQLRADGLLDEDTEWWETVV